MTRKKLIEVALPLEAINKASAREKSIRHGHPSTLHLWWARRPLAACRAVLFASLVDDPDSDPVYRRSDGTVDEDAAGIKRAELFTLIEELVQWENSNNPQVINAARAEIARCVASRKLELGELKKDTVVFEGGEGTGDRSEGTGDRGQGTGERVQEAGVRKPKAGAKGTGKSALAEGRSLSSGMSPCGPKRPRSWGPPDQTVAWDILTMNARPEAVNAFLVEHAPPVLDPFCGGGSIPLEAQRLGLRAYASDLNPVPVLITKALIEIPPRFSGKSPVNPKADKKITWHGAEGLADDVRYYGRWMRDEAEKRIGHLYPRVTVTEDMTKERPDLKPLVGQTLTVIAWLWARTVSSPNPAVGGVPVPLVRTFVVSTKPGGEAWVKPEIDRDRGAYRFHVRVGKPTDKGATEAGTKIARGCKFRCLISGEPIPDQHVKDEGVFGRLDARLMAIAAEGTRGRVYFSPSDEHESAAKVKPPTNLGAVEAPIALDKRAIWCLLYGIDRFDKLFTARQLTALSTFSDLLAEVRAKVAQHSQRSAILPLDDGNLDAAGAGAAAYADAVVTYLALAVDKAADYWTTLCFWHNGAAHLKIVNTFARQALPMSWDFAEANPFSESSGHFFRFVDLISEVVETAVPGHGVGVVQQLHAKNAGADAGNVVFSTDPPYYDNIGYSDLSDFFYVWLRRSLSLVYPCLFSTLITPKSQELIASPYRHGGDCLAAKRFFETGLGEVFRNIRQRQVCDIPATVFYAFKQQETDDNGAGEPGAVAISTGWETMLEGLVQAGFSIESTWPIRTELTGNLKKHVAALASSVVLSCRPRPTEARLTTRREFLNELKRALPDALRHLRRGGIAPVDLAQAAIGPGMAVFTRYAKVMETDGSAMSVRAALGLINQALDEVLAEQEGEFDADTRWALAWFEQFGMDEGSFGVAETLSKAKNTAVSGLAEAGVVKARAGKVRLLRREELPIEWDPATDRRFTIWEATQHLIHRLENEGEEAAAALLRKLGGTAEVARDLAYRLYSICERKKWAEEALAYNGLVIAWPELTRLARATPAPKRSDQAELFER